MGANAATPFGSFSDVYRCRRRLQRNAPWESLVTNAGLICDLDRMLVCLWNRSEHLMWVSHKKRPRRMQNISAGADQNKRRASRLMNAEHREQLCCTFQGCAEVDIKSWRVLPPCPNTTARIEFSAPPFYSHRLGKNNLTSLLRQRGDSNRARPRWRFHVLPSEPVLAGAFSGRASHTGDGRHTEMSLCQKW